MEPTELVEVAEKVHRREERQVGLTMAVFAVLLAIATMLGHRTHTEETVLETRVADQWALYQARNIRSHMYAADGQLAALFPNGGEKLAQDFQRRSEQYRKEADHDSDEAHALQREAQATSVRAGYYDVSEIFLEVAIVLCSISLLTLSPLYWRVSFLSTAIGLIVIIAGALHK